MSNIRNDLEPRYRQPPVVCKECPTNSLYPDESWMKYERSVIFPTNKSLYTSIPNYYPFQTINKPVNTLYSIDNSLFTPRGKRLTFQRKPYPQTGWSPKEHRFYADDDLSYPIMQDFTKYPVQTTTSVNLGLERVNSPHHSKQNQDYKNLGMYV